MEKRYDFWGVVYDEDGVKSLVVPALSATSLIEPDMIFFAGKLYTKVDHDAIERIVNDLVSVEELTGPVVTGPSCRMLAERIKRAVGLWQK